MRSAMITVTVVVCSLVCLATARITKDEGRFDDAAYPARSPVQTKQRDQYDPDEFPSLTRSVNTADSSSDEENTYYADTDESVTYSLSSTLSLSDDIDALLDENSESLSLTMSDSLADLDGNQESESGPSRLSRHGTVHEDINNNNSGSVNSQSTEEHTETPLQTPTHEGVYVDDSSAINVPKNESAVVKALESESSEGLNAASDDTDRSDSEQDQIVQDFEQALFSGVRILDDAAIQQQQITFFSMQVSQAYRDAFFGALLSVFTVGTLAILILLAHAVRRRQWYELHHPQHDKHPYEDHPHAPIHIV